MRLSSALPTFNLQPANLQPANLQPANLQPSTFNLQPANLQPSTFNLQPSTFNLQPLDKLQLSGFYPSALGQLSKIAKESEEKSKASVLQNTKCYRESIIQEWQFKDE
jgi:uncharacterized protein YjbI with pentapeptide repeats